MLSLILFPGRFIGSILSFHILILCMRGTFAADLPKQFNVKILTWNLAETSPNEKDCEFLKEFRDSDMVVIGVQETENLKPRRHEGSRSRAWRALQQASLGNTFDCLTKHKLGGMQLAVYAKKRITKKVFGHLTLEVSCGVGNVLSNKGCICILLRMKGKTIALVNAHFAAHQGKYIYFFQFNVLKMCNIMSFCCRSRKSEGTQC